MTELFVVITVIVVALIFDFTNGFHDSANAMAGPIATGALRPRVAVILAAVLNLVGACLSTAVAKTISGGLFDDSLITAPIILAGLLGAIIWNLVTWLVGLPSSSSHALFGGLIGAVIVGAGLSSVNGSVIVSKISPPLGAPGWPIALRGRRRACTAIPDSGTGRRSLPRWSHSLMAHPTGRRPWVSSRWCS